MTNEIEVITDNQEWYQSLVEDCRSIMTEAVFNSRWALVEGYHMLGERIANDLNFKKHAKGNQSSLQGLARNLGMSERSVYNAVAFVKKFPDINTLPQGKNISWNKIVTELLPAPPETETETETHALPNEKRCPNCNFLL